MFGREGVRVVGFVAVACLWLSSCVTTALWGGDIEGGDGNGGLDVDWSGARSGPGETTLRVLATPVTLAVDVCSSPFQALYFSGDPLPLIEAVFSGESLVCLFE